MTKEAKSKKDAQTLTAWAFSDELVKAGKVGRGDLPPRPECVVKTNEAGNQQKVGMIDPEGKGLSE